MELKADENSMNLRLCMVDLARVFLYKGLRIFTICSKTFVGQWLPSVIAGSWFTSGQ